MLWHAGFGMLAASLVFKASCSTFHFKFSKIKQPQAGNLMCNDPRGDSDDLIANIKTKLRQFTASEGKYSSFNAFYCSDSHAGSWADIDAAQAQIAKFDPSLTLAQCLDFAHGITLAGSQDESGLGRSFLANLILPLGEWFESRKAQTNPKNKEKKGKAAKKTIKDPELWPSLFSSGLIRRAFTLSAKYLTEEEILLVLAPGKTYYPLIVANYEAASQFTHWPALPIEDLGRIFDFFNIVPSPNKSSPKPGPSDWDSGAPTAKDTADNDSEIYGDKLKLPFWNLPRALQSCASETILHVLALRDFDLFPQEMDMLCRARGLEAMMDDPVLGQNIHFRLTLQHWHAASLTEECAKVAGIKAVFAHDGLVTELLRSSESEQARFQKSVLQYIIYSEMIITVLVDYASKATEGPVAMDSVLEHIFDIICYRLLLNEALNAMRYYNPSTPWELLTTCPFSPHMQLALSGNYGDETTKKFIKVIDCFETKYPTILRKLYGSVPRDVCNIRSLSSRTIEGFKLLEGQLKFCLQQAKFFFYLLVLNIEKSPNSVNDAVTQALYEIFLTPKLNTTASLNAVFESGQRLAHLPLLSAATYYPGIAFNCAWPPFLQQLRPRLRDGPDHSQIRLSILTSLITTISFLGNEEYHHYNMQTITTLFSPKSGSPDINTITYSNAIQRCGPIMRFNNSKLVQGLDDGSIPKTLEAQQFLLRFDSLNGLGAELVASLQLPLDKGRFFLPSCDDRILIDYVKNIHGIINDPLHFVFSVRSDMWDLEEFQRVSWTQLVLPIFVVDPSKLPLLGIAMCNSVSRALQIFVSELQSGIKNLIWVLIQYTIFMDYNYHVATVWGGAKENKFMRFYEEHWLPNEVRARESFAQAIPNIVDSLLNAFQDEPADESYVDLVSLIRDLNWVTMTSPARAHHFNQAKSKMCMAEIGHFEFTPQVKSQNFIRFLLKYAPSRASAKGWTVRYYLCRKQDPIEGNSKFLETNCTEDSVPVFDWNMHSNS